MTHTKEGAAHVVTLPWPARPWTEGDDAWLRDNHGKLTIQQLASGLGRSMAAVRGRITRLGIAKRVFWSAEDEAKLVDLYHKAGPDGVLNLGAFARGMGRDPGNISRKAKELGLPTNLKRRVVESRKITPNKYATPEERSAAMSVVRKKWHEENDHPRGMKGRQHSDATRQHLSRTSKAAHLMLSEEEKAGRILKSLKKRRAQNNGIIAPPVRRGTWEAGWREIGGTRKYYRSRWEANYARYLQWLKEHGEILDWQHEPETFWFEAVRRGVRSYLPDFRVWERNGTIILHEVKGWMDQRSRTALKRMAKYHPEQKIIVIDGRQYRAIRLKVMRLIPGWEDAKRDSHA